MLRCCTMGRSASISPCCWSSARRSFRAMPCCSQRFADAARRAAARVEFSACRRSQLDKIESRGAMLLRGLSPGRRPHTSTSPRERARTSRCASTRAGACPSAASRCASTGTGISGPPTRFALPRGTTRTRARAAHHRRHVLIWTSRSCPCAPASPRWCSSSEPLVWCVAVLVCVRVVWWAVLSLPSRTLHGSLPECVLSCPDGSGVRACISSLD